MSVTRRQLLGAAAVAAATVSSRPLDSPIVSGFCGEGTSDALSYPEALVTGCSSRSFAEAQGTFRNHIDGVVVSDWTWADLNPTPGALDESVLDKLVAALDWCQSNTGTSGKPLKARLRVHAGYLSPAWVKQATGGAMPWATSNAVQPSWQAAPEISGWAFLPGGVPQWWKSAMSDAYAELQFLLASRVGSHPALAETCVTLPCTQFEEPCIRQGDVYQGNSTVAYSNGYTRDLDLASFQSSYAAHAAHWSPLRIATRLAFTPFQELTADAAGPTAGDASTTIDLMNDMVTALGRMTVWGNDGFRNPAPDTQSADYAAMYTAQFEGALKDPPVCLAYQTKTLTKFDAQRLTYPTSNLPDTVQRGVEVKATGVELPVGCTQPAIWYRLSVRVRGV
ncbi:MAG: hypothetical protein WKF82_05785 [Nocardioidaceae bacterium]